MGSERSFPGRVVQQPKLGAHTCLHSEPTVADQELKTCSDCGLIKPRGLFPAASSRDGRKPYCKCCQGKRRKRLRQLDQLDTHATKICKACGLEKSVKLFNRRGNCTGGYSPLCKECSNNNERMRFRKYGISAADYDEQLKRQNYRCAICRTDDSGKRRFHVDHDHSTGIVRGLLCSNCNTGIGLLKDSPSTLRAAIEYIEAAKLQHEEPLCLS
jgi:hypothetical protein